MIFTAIAGVLFGIRTIFDPALDHPAHSRLRAVIIGGLGSMWGTLIGGMVLGIAQSSAPRSIRRGNPRRTLGVLAILILRPNGLFPRTRD